VLRRAEFFVKAETAGIGPALCSAVPRATFCEHYRLGAEPPNHNPHSVLLRCPISWAELSKTDAKRALAALDEVVLEELGNAQNVRIGGLVQLAVRVKPAQKARPGRNPATGDEIGIAAKPKSVDLRARPLARAKSALPTVQKARRRLAA
jgi:nucleoid DNA-binding protein